MYDRSVCYKAHAIGELVPNDQHAYKENCLMTVFANYTVSQKKQDA